MNTIESLISAYRNGTAKPNEVVRRFLDKIEANNDYYSAYQSVWAEEAMALADSATKAQNAGQELRPLHGIPIAIKDIFHVSGKITTCGSMELIDNVSDRTSTVVKRLIDAGAIILGKTKTVECAFGGWGTNQKMGTPRNPWDDDVYRIPGGSSSGSAVAMAAGLTICAIGSDTGGSVRLPAAYCGVVGLKVTYGRMPNFGIMPLSQTLDSPGPFAKTVRDSILLFDVMDGRENWEVIRDHDRGLNNFCSLERGVCGLKMGCLSEDERQHCSAETLDAYDDMLQKLQSKGAIIQIFKNPVPYGELADRNGAITSVEAYSNHRRLYEDEKRQTDSDVRARMLSGKQYAAYEYYDMLNRRRIDIKSFHSQMQGFDVLITPTTIDRAPILDEVNQEIAPSYYTRPFNYLDMCAISIPIGLDSMGLPKSIQVIAKPNQEHSIFRVGVTVETLV